MPTQLLDLVQFGGVGLAFFLAWILYKLVTNHESHFIDIMKDNTENTRENTRVLQELKDVILSLKRK